MKRVIRASRRAQTMEQSTMKIRTQAGALALDVIPLASVQGTEGSKDPKTTGAQAAVTAAPAPLPTRSLARRLSLPVLHFIGHSPLILFAVGVTVVTLLLLPFLDQQSNQLGHAIGADAAGQRAILDFTNGFRRVWLGCLAGFYLASILGSLIVAWTHRVLSNRLRRIVAHAEKMGSGRHDAALFAEADDVLGNLENALTRVGSELNDRESTRRKDAEHREQLARIQRAMAMVDTEEDALRVVGRALYTLVRGTSAELLMADPSNQHLTRVASSTTAAPPGCGVASPGAVQPSIKATPWCSPIARSSTPAPDCTSGPPPARRSVYQWSSWGEPRACCTPSADKASRSRPAPSRRSRR